MSARRILHQLVDELPAEDLSTAERVLQALNATAAPHVPLKEAPIDDDFDGGLAEARADAEAGRVVPHEEVNGVGVFREVARATSLLGMRCRGIKAWVS